MMLNFAEQTGSGAVIMVWSFLENIWVNFPAIILPQTKEKEEYHICMYYKLLLLLPRLHPFTVL